MDELTVNFSCSSGSSSQHTIYCKRHNVRQPSNLTPNNRTLFTTGWPPYCSINEIKELFSRAVGQIEDVFLQESTGSVDENKPLSGGYMVGYIVFHEESDVTRALSLCSEEIAPLNCCIGETGLKKWCHEYQENYQSENILEKGSKMGVTAYDEWLEKERKRKKHLSEPDEEGWVTVTKKTPITTAHRPKKKKKSQTLKLYAFQQRETQRNRIVELRKKFQEDKQRVEAMKANRKFKPF